MPALPPLVAPDGDPDASAMRRGARLAVLDGVGLDGLWRLAAARVLVIGAGGLGSPALQYLAAAGVGTIGVVDDDVVDESNLGRQVLHATAEVGEPKVESVVRALARLSPGTEVVPIRRRLDAANARELLDGWHVVLDGSDTFPTRYAVSDAAEAVGIPHVWGSTLGWDGQAAVFWAAPPAALDGSVVPGVTLRDVFPDAPAEADTCELSGVLGPLCGEIGSVLAGEVVKLLTGAGESLLGRMLVVDARDGSRDVLDVRRGAAGGVLGSAAEAVGGAGASPASGNLGASAPDSRPAVSSPFPSRVPGVPGAETAPGAGVAAEAGNGLRSELQRPVQLPSALSIERSAAAARAAGTDAERVITVEQFDAALAGEAPPRLVDVREEFETWPPALEGAVRVPHAELLADASVLGAPDPDAELVVYCRSGARSSLVADHLQRLGWTRARSLEGGLLARAAARRERKPTGG